MIEISDVSKKYGPKTAVDQVTFTARPGRVTGFLGPKGGREVQHVAHSAGS